MGVMTTRRKIVRVRGDVAREHVDDVVVESPLAIAVEDTTLVTTMRTPGHDLELAAGWLVADADVRQAADIIGMGAFVADPANPNEVDTVRVALAPEIVLPEPRAHLTSSACGVCSSRLLTEVSAPAGPLQSEGWTVTVEALLDLPVRMRERQRAFERTGGVHAAAVVDSAGALMVVHEDVGRHNAVDKVIGHCLMAEGLPLTDCLIVVSGRVSFEIVQKAIAAGAAGIVAVSAPSSLAVDLARVHGLLLVGLVRGSTLNVYSCQSRVVHRAVGARQPIGQPGVVPHVNMPTKPDPCLR